VHRQTVARRVLKGYAATEVPTEHIPTRRVEAQRKFADLLDDIGSRGLNGARSVEDQRITGVVA
jgi:hypothetical protein